MSEIQFGSRAMLAAGSGGSGNTCNAASLNSEFRKKTASLRIGTVELIVGKPEDQAPRSIRDRHMHLLMSISDWTNQHQISSDQSTAGDRRNNEPINKR